MYGVYDVKGFHALWITIFVCGTHLTGINYIKNLFFDVLEPRYLGVGGLKVALMESVNIKENLTVGKEFSRNKWINSLLFARIIFLYNQQAKNNLQMNTEILAHTSKMYKQE